MHGAPLPAWPRPLIGWLATIGGLCIAAGMLWPSRLGLVLLWLAAPVLILGAGVFLAVAWRSPHLGRWARAVSTCGVAIYLVFLLALIACGDVEGGIPVGAQTFWQPVWIAAMITAAPILITGGALMLLPRARLLASEESH